VAKNSSQLPAPRRPFKKGFTSSKTFISGAALAAASCARTADTTGATARRNPVVVYNDISCWSQNRRAVTVLDSAQARVVGQHVVAEPYRADVFDRGQSPGTQTASAEISRPVRLAATRFAARIISP
jgi:hypothetical protein